MNSSFIQSKNSNETVLVLDQQFARRELDKLRQIKSPNTTEDNLVTEREQTSGVMRNVSRQRKQST